MPPKSVDQNIFEMSKVEKKAAKIEALPCNLLDAVRELEKDEFIKDVLGEHMTDLYVRAKKAEWNDYTMQVTSWEVDQYLYKF